MIGMCVLRCLFGFVLSLCLGFVLCPYVFTFFRKKNVCQAERGREIIRDLADLHKSKLNTPTMGGVMIFFSAVIAIFCLAKLNFYVLTVLAIGFTFGILGFVDDYLKITKKNVAGVRGKYKLLVQCIASIFLFTLMMGRYGGVMGSMFYPMVCFKSAGIFTGASICIFVFFVLAGTSNAVNLTDGLDGLASLCLVPNFVFFGLAALAIGDKNVSNLLHLTHIEGISELAIVFSCFLGAITVFLWYNSYPASIMMGDCGSLMLGGILGAGAMLLMLPLCLPVTGIVFVAEALSVIIQTTFFKLSGGKRVFLMTPIHHHFELSGVRESKIVTRAGIVSSVATGICLLAVLCYAR